MVRIVLYIGLLPRGTHCNLRRFRRNLSRRGLINHNPPVAVTAATPLSPSLFNLTPPIPTGGNGWEGVWRERRGGRTRKYLSVAERICVQPNTIRCGREEYGRGGQCLCVGVCVRNIEELVLCFVM